MSDIFVGIDLGGTNIKIGCFNSELKLLCNTSTPTEADQGPEHVINKMAETTEKLLEDNSFDPNDIAAVGLGSPGQFDLKKGIILNSPNMPLFKNLPLRQMLSDRFGKPAALENDANAACWGEYVAGAGKDIDDMVFFTLGTGIGGGIVSEGKMLHGSDDNGAELGHMIIFPDGRQCNCGQKGCVEAHASASWTAKRAEEAINAGEDSSLKQILDDKGKITCKDVYDHLAKGDALAKKVTDETAKALAITCINMLHTTEPKRIVFAGGMIAAGDILLNRIKEYFDEYIWSMKKETVEICFATIGEDAGIIGTADLARQLVK